MSASRFFRLRSIQPSRFSWRIALDGLRRQPLSGLGGDERPLAAALLQHPGDQLLGTAVAIDVGGVDEGDAGIERGVQGGHRLVVIDLAPGGADRP